jgi:2-haloacid dehalogenase
VGNTTIGIGLDVYGTLVDPLGITDYLRPYAGAQAERMAETWRAKQLEYSFRRAAMGRYANFDICTRQALEWVLSAFDINLSGDQVGAILEKYKRLPAYPDAESGLSSLKANGYALYAFSNGVGESLKMLLGDAGLLAHLDGVISVDEVRTFKPDPRVYDHLARRLGFALSNSWLVSCNAFDVIGAKAAGLKSAWIKRAGTTVFDPWGIEPDIIARDLNDLAYQLSSLRSGR